MAHSHHMHREHQVSHRRVNHILKDEPAGAKHHAGGGAFSKVTSKSAAEHHDMKVSGSKGKKRFARGGAAYRGEGPFPGQSQSDFQEGKYGEADRKSRMNQGYKRGGAAKHPDEAEDKKLIKKMIRQHDEKKFARGGKVKGNTTNIIIAGGGQKPEPVPVPVPGPMAAGPMAGPPPGAVPGGPPPGMPPGPMPMRARGGKVIDGEATAADIKAWGKRARDNSYFRGGAASGVGREEKAEHMRRKRR